MNWLIGVSAILVIGYLLDREIYFYEGVHLGPRVQAWLYDRWSRKYDAGKRESQIRDIEMLARPLLAQLHSVEKPLILDFATGTGRLSSALLSQPEFAGHIIALDLSQGMLEQAELKLRAFQKTAQYELLRHTSLPLPFPDLSFDVVCALEVLELFPDMRQPLTEFSRVLKPGGVLLTSRGTEASGRKAKVKSRFEQEQLLKDYQFEDVRIDVWWKLFDRVLARKAGASAPAGAHTLSELLRCGKCGQIEWKVEAQVWACQKCGHALTVTEVNILLS